MPSNFVSLRRDSTTLSIVLLRINGVAKQLNYFLQFPRRYFWISFLSRRDHFWFCFDTALYEFKDARQHPAFALEFFPRPDRFVRDRGASWSTYSLVFASVLLLASHISKTARCGAPGELY